MKPKRIGRKTFLLAWVMGTIGACLGQWLFRMLK